MSKFKHSMRKVVVMILSVLLCLSQAGALSLGFSQKAKAAGIVTYNFDTTTIPSSGVVDKQEFAEGTSFHDGFFRLSGSVMQRLTGEGLTKCIELGKSMSGALEFTIDGYAVVTLKVSSNGTENTSPISLIDATTEEILDNEEGISLVSTTGSTKLTYYLTSGTYRVVSPEDPSYQRGVRIFSAEVSVSKDGPIEPRTSWINVGMAKIQAIDVDGDKINVSFTGVVGYDGADYVEVIMTNDDNPDISQTLQYSEDCEEGGVLTFTPTASGNYTFNISTVRSGLDPKPGFPKKAEFVLPVAKASIATASSVGDGKIKVTWPAVPEATDYEVYCNSELVEKTKKTSLTVSGLTIDEAYDFQVKAYRNEEEGELSEKVRAIAYQEAVIAWGFTRYGSSTNDENNGYEGDISEGSITVYSEGGKGKIVPNSTDGIAFFYTAVETDQNFTLKATAHVDNWTFSNGQDGFGLIATDRLGTNGDSTAFWNNQYMAVATKVEYYWDPAEKKVSQSGTKYTMKLGLGVIGKTGVTKENLARLQTNDTETVNAEFNSEMRPLETSAASQNLESGTYNIVGNMTTPVDGTIAETTDFILQLQKNNTGYFISYFDEAGNLLAQEKFYDPDALSMVDDENVYVGFFASRNARVTFSDIEFNTIAAAEDAPKEERPVTEVVPQLNITSATVANSAAYTLTLVANADGVVSVSSEKEELVQNQNILSGEKINIPVTLLPDEANKLQVTYTPNADYIPGEYMVLANTDTISLSHSVTYCTRFADLHTIYVSPTGSADGTGRSDSPIDIYTAVDCAQPGQTILLASGKYSLSKTVRIQRGINGTADAMITMTSDPSSLERPVFDFGNNCAGFVLGGDYWYFFGFDCTNSANGQKGIQVSGDNNTLDQVNAYHNGNTGIQISRLTSNDSFEDWPANNLILNCTSYGNADSGYEDADGFAAKLTVGEGNVFDGCLSYNNADDGWDLFAKVESGSIGAVTIKNSVAYGNGYLEDGTNAGNGNGFKMGGDSLSGYHKLENSIAFHNKAKGIDSNSCPDIQVENSTSYNNESYNVAFYTNNAANTDFSATGILSVKDGAIKSGLDIAEQFKTLGSQDATKYLNDANYYWGGTKSSNASGDSADASWFISTQFTEITRNADGTLNMNHFLELSDSAKAGASMQGTPSRVIEIPENEEPSASSSGSEGTGHEGTGNEGTGNEGTGRGFKYGIAAAAALLCGCVGLVIARKKKKKK